jgi:hypothetical protein
MVTCTQHSSIPALRNDLHADTPGARSMSSSPVDVTSITPSSVMIRLTTPRPVIGSEHLVSAIATQCLVDRTSHRRGEID